MCGIIGFFNSSKKRNILLGLQAIRERGRDGCGIYINGKIQRAKTPEQLKARPCHHALGHVLHSIVGTCLQPIKGKGILVTNSEIYNWKDVKKSEKLRVGNDSKLLLKLFDKGGINDTLSVLRGVYAFAYLRNDKLVLCRDIVGIKPIFYSREDGLAFCSEPKGLKALGYKQIEELNPRSILYYDIEKDKTTFRGRSFFRTTPILQDQQRSLIRNLDNLLEESLRRRIPNKKFALLLSGGLDSALLALKLKKSGVNFTCYTAGISDPRNFAVDIDNAKKLAKAIKLKHKCVMIDRSEVPEYLKIIVPLIEDANVVKAGVALPLFLACEQAKKDKVKVIFTGLGADELFGGYARQKKASDLNKECASYVLKAYEKDTFRDDVVSMHNNLELRVPYYDIDLVKYALQIPPRFKITEQTNKYILRELAKYCGLPIAFAERKKKATQYGSNADKAISYHAKQEGCKTKSAYLNKFLNRPNLKLGALFSGGKDSALAAYLMQKRGYEISCLISIKSANKDSYMFHTPNISLVDLQAKAMQIPLVKQNTQGAKEKELQDLKRAIKKAKDKFGIQGIIVGAIRSSYQRDRVEKICDALGLKIFAPLWHMDQEHEVRLLLKFGFKFMLVSIAAFGLDKSWLGRTIGPKDIERLLKLKKSIGLNVAGEGGEYETLVVDCPMFIRKLIVDEYEILEENEETARLNISRASLAKSKRN